MRSNQARVKRIPEFHSGSIKVPRINIRAWLEQHFKVLGQAEEVHVNCPFCGDRRGRLYVLATQHGDKPPGLMWCHNEQRSYSFSYLYATLENISLAEANKILYSDEEASYGRLDQAEASLTTEARSVQDEQKLVPVELPPGFIPLFGLSTEKWQQYAPVYVKQRNIDQKICDDYRLGVCRTGLFANRLIIPIYFHGILVSYQGRALDNKLKPKYRFSLGAPASRFLFNWDNIPLSEHTVILTEGVFDVFGVIRSGYKNVVCSFGKHLSASNRRLIRNRFKKLIILWDADAKEAIIELQQQLDGGGLSVEIAALNSKDPAEASANEVKLSIEQAKAGVPEDFRWEAVKERLLANAN